MPARTTKKSAKKTTKKSPAKKTPAAKQATRAHAWTAPTLMAELEKLGSEQSRKIYARHGAPAASMYGVSFANIYALQKQIKRDHDLAAALWNSGNSDAQTLAALIADPGRATRAELEQWAKSASWFMTVDYLATFIATTPHALPLAKKWTKSRDEFIRRAGYSTLNSLLKNGAPDGNPLDTDFLRAVLATIEKEIHSSPNRAREAMNTTVICIGVYHDPLHKDAVAAARRIGFVKIDHGKDTSCKDFIATDEIAKARAHRAKRKAAR